jgi:hypothetical protein
MKILFTHSPRYPWVNTQTVVAFNVDNLRTGNHLKNLLATVVIINNSSGQQKMFKFNHLYAPNGVFSKISFSPPGHVSDNYADKFKQSAINCSGLVQYHCYSISASSLSFIITIAIVVIISIIVGSITYLLESSVYIVL